jgi:hypothetical protein
VNRVEIAIADGQSLRLGVVADTHGRPHPRAHELLAELRPDAILHAGDIGDPVVLEDLAGIAPVHAVRGNIDPSTPDIPDALTLDLTRPADRIRILLMHIAVAGPRLRADAARLARAQRAALVVCGHSHVPFIGVDRGLIMFNPGSIGPRRFTLPIVFGVIDLPAGGKLHMRHVSCETGHTWSPP